MENRLNDKDLFQKIGREKIESLRDSIYKVELLIDERLKLRGNIIDEAEGMKLEINNFLANQPTDSEAYKERIALKQKQIEISELQLNEKINCWNDIANLKKELRDYKRELSEKEARSEMFREVFDENA